jgi:hypothetical protein
VAKVHIFVRAFRHLNATSGRGTDGAAAGIEINSGQLGLSPFQKSGI